MNPESQVSESRIPSEGSQCGKMTVLVVVVNVVKMTGLVFDVKRGK